MMLIVRDVREAAILARILIIEQFEKTSPCSARAAVAARRDKSGATRRALRGVTHQARPRHLPGDRSEIAEVGFGPILPVDVAYAPGTHRLVAVGATARSVDAAGNTTSRGDGVGLAYDARNRLTQVTLPGGNTRYTYLYNGKGERVGKKKTLAGSPVGASYFVYDEGGRLLGEYTASGAAVAEYLYFNDALYAVATPTDLYYVETDHLGTPRTLVSSARQTVVWSWDALDAKGAFGASAADADPDHDGVPMVFNLRFPGQYYDAETGLHYIYFRDYEKETGRYIQSDPIGLAGGISSYGYVRANPLKLIDPQGLKVQVCCRKAEILFGLFRHCWIKTDTITAGMSSSPQCRANVGDDYEPPFITPTYISDHSCETPDTCTDLPPHFNVDEDCVNRELNIGTPLGGFDPFVNNCQQFTARVIKRCSKPGWPSPTPTPPPPAPAPGGGGGCCK